MEKIDLTLIVPTYNGEKTIHILMNSLLPQLTDNIEVLLINDGSTDGTEKLFQKYAQEYENVRYISQPNKGLSGARNTGIENARGKYISFPDCDDFYAPDFIEKTKKVLKTDADLIIFDFNAVYQNGKIESWLHLPEEDTLYPDKYEGFEGYLNHGYTDIFGNFAWNKFYKRSIFLEHQLSFPLGKRMGEDFVLIMEYWYYCNTITILHEKLHNYMVYNTSTVRKFKKWLIEDYQMYYQLIPSVCKKYKFHNYEVALAKLYLSATKSVIKNEAYLENYTTGRKNMRNFFQYKPFQTGFHQIRWTSLPLKSKLYYWIVRFRLYSIVYIIYKLYFKVKGR